MRLRIAFAGLIAAAAVSACDGGNTTVPRSPPARPRPRWPAPPRRPARPPPRRPVPPRPRRRAPPRPRRRAPATPTAGPTATPTAGPTATPTAGPTATPAPLTLSAATVSLTSPGQNAPFTVSEAGYSGALSATSASCSGIATFSPAAGSGPSATFTVTAVAAGQCTIVVSDSHGQSVSETVYVTTTTGTAT